MSAFEFALRRVLLELGTDDMAWDSTREEGWGGGCGTSEALDI